MADLASHRNDALCSCCVGCFSLPQAQCLCFCSPLHLAIIHEQAAVVGQLVQVALSIPNQRIINIANHLQQVSGHSPRRRQQLLSKEQAPSPPTVQWCVSVSVSPGPPCLVPPLSISSLGTIMMVWLRSP